MLSGGSVGVGGVSTRDGAPALTTCTVVTSTSVYDLRQDVPPSQLFVDMLLAGKNPEDLAMTLRLDSAALYVFATHPSQQSVDQPTTIVVVDHDHDSGGVSVNLLFSVGGVPYICASVFYFVDSRNAGCVFIHLQFLDADESAVVRHLSLTDFVCNNVSCLSNTHTCLLHSHKHHATRYQEGIRALLAQGDEAAARVLPLICAEDSRAQIAHGDVVPLLAEMGQIGLLTKCVERNNRTHH